MTSPDQPADLAEARYLRMLWNTPLSPAHAGVLLDVLQVGDGHTVVDLGCGWAELLLRAVADTGARGVGVDTDDAALGRAERLAAGRELTARVSFASMPAADWPGVADRAICIGASHAFGGTEAALRRLHRMVGAGGRLLYGDGIWQKAAGPEAQAIFGDDVQPLPALAEMAVHTGWRVLHLSTADQLEWDVFESTWRQGRQEWLLAHAGDPRAADVRADLDRQQREYLRTYRGVLGFAYLVLGH